jgi:hypothetical protein
MNRTVLLPVSSISLAGGLRGRWRVILRVHSATARPGGGIWSGSRSGLPVDQRLLGLERRRIRLGAGPLGPPSTAARTVGGASLGKKRQTLSLPPRSL